MSLATMTSKGQITLPKEIREALGLEPGTKVDFRLLDDGRVEMRKAVPDPLAVAGILRREGERALSPQIVQERVAEYLAAKHGKPRR